LTKIITTLKYLSDHKINTYDLETLFCELFYHLLLFFTPFLHKICLPFYSFITEVNLKRLCISQLGFCHIIM